MFHMKLIKYLESWFDSGECKYAAGSFYPVTDETKLHASRGVAEEVDAPEDVEKAEAIAGKAAEKADAAAAAANAAAALANAAAAAQQMGQAPA